MREGVEGGGVKGVFARVGGLKGGQQFTGRPKPRGKVVGGQPVSRRPT